MEGQLLVAQLPLLLEQRTAQHTLRRQSSPSGLAHPLAAQIARHQTYQPALAIQPLRDRLQLAADLVPRKHFEYSGLDGAFLTHCRLRGAGGLGDAVACSRNLPETAEPCLHKI